MIANFLCAVTGRRDSGAFARAATEPASASTFDRQGRMVFVFPIEPGWCLFFLSSRRVGDILANEVKPATTSTAGWRDLSVNGRRWIMQNGQYQLAR